jgi:two-component system sensor histidine kinase KdpD
MKNGQRPDPDDLLRLIATEEATERCGRLRIFLGMSAGVGKTFAMLKAAQQRQLEGTNVVIGIVETHGRVETANLISGLELIPRIKINYRGTALEELDVDAILLRKPDIVLVDELAHSNVPGLRHEKRYQDVLELLDAGISVYTTINVQHFESRKDAVEAITQIQIRETVPDSILERASQVELVDIAPSELLKRLKEGKVYLGDSAERAARGFFKEDRLTALREIALRCTAERVDQDLQRLVPIGSEREPWQTNERLMVAVSHSPDSERLIRATRRLAYNLDAPWIAVYIDTGLHLSDSDQTQLNKNLALARELKAEVVATTEIDISAALKRIARQKNVTQILVGRPSRRWVSDLLSGGTLLDRLVRANHELDVHVIRQETAPQRLRVSQPALSQIRFFSGPEVYWNSLWFLAGVTILSGLAEPLIGYHMVGFLFLAAVLTVGALASLGPVLFSAVLSALLWNYFFIPPRLTFSIGQPEDMVLCGVFLTVAVVVGYLTTRVRLREQMLREREERTNVLYEVLKDIANSTGKSEFLLKVTSRVGRILNAECGVFLSDRQGEILFDYTQRFAVGLSEKEQAVATWAFKSQKMTGWSTGSLADATSLYIPLKGISQTVGVFVFTPKSIRKLNLEQEALLFSIVTQLAGSLERYFFEKRLLETHRLEDSEKLHQTLLNSISHEMRTPLTTIIGSASALEIPENAQNAQFVQTMAAHLVLAGDRLNRVIENLLDMSRLNSGHLELKFEWHDIHDLIGVTLSKLAKNVDSHPVKINLPDYLPVIRMDFRLMEHALANIILNAINYSPLGSELVISAEYSSHVLKLFFDDAGPGIAAEVREKIFDKFYRIPGTPTGGTGLGLSIVKSIVEAHKGEVAIAQSPARGARFIISLPVFELAPPVPPEQENEVKR